MFTPAHEIPLDVRRMAAATHEAGHAIVAIVLGRKVTGAILRAPEGLSGETQFEREPDRLLDLNEEADRRVVEDAIIVLYAGQVAEAVYWTAVESKYKPRVDTHRDDEQEIVRILKGFNFADEQDAEFRGHCIAKAKQMLDDPRSKAALAEVVSKLTDALSISRAELDEILIRHDVIAAPKLAIE